MSIYWQRECELTITQVKKRWNEPALIQELIDEKVMKVDGDNISIQFLDNHHDNIVEISKVRSENGRKGNQKRWGDDRKPIANPSQSDRKSIASRVEYSRVEESIGDKSKGKKIKVFIPPTELEIESYIMDELKNIPSNQIKNISSSIFDYYQSKGWLVGKSKMKDWQAAVRNWVRNIDKFGNGQNKPKPIGGVFVP